LPICCSSKLGGRVLFPSCYVHYEIAGFYNATAVAAESPPPPPPPATLPIPEGKVSVLYLVFFVNFLNCHHSKVINYFRMYSSKF
jgi:hypothetical protein